MSLTFRWGLSGTWTTCARKRWSSLWPPPGTHLQEEARLPELPEVTVAVALARVMVGGPVFAAHVEDEWIANAEKEARHAVRGCLEGLFPCRHREWPT